MNKAKSLLSGIVLVAVCSVGFKFDTPTNLVAPVNSYVSDSMLYVSDAKTGIHVYSVKDQKHPVKKIVIPVQNNGGLAVKGDIIYANSNNAILAIRMHDDSLYDVVKVINKVEYFMGNDIVGYGGAMSCGCQQYANPIAAGTGSETNNSGVGGSYAIFAVIDSFLYYLDKSSIVTLDISKPADPKELSRTYIAWSVETLFPTQKYLFVGGTTGMYILDRQDAANPVTIGSVQHFKSCDPVVVRDTLAYVTLRGGSRCGAIKDELMIVNIADPSKPFIVSETNIESPYGLSISDSLLYVAKGTKGFSLFNVNNQKSPEVVADWHTPDVRDFIWDKKTLYVMGLSDVSIYNVDDPKNPLKLSTVE